MRQAGAARAMWLMARLRLLRLWNMVAGFRFRVAAQNKSRKATASKKRVGWVLGALVGLAMLASVLNLSHESVQQAHCLFGAGAECLQSGDHAKDAARELARSSPAVSDAPFESPVLRALSLQFALLFLISILLPLGTREMAQADWDLEWLVTLPVERGTLLWGRILERTLANPSGWLFLAPAYTMMALYSGLRWSAPLVGVAAALLLLPLAAMARTVIDTGLRLSLPPSQLRNLQAVAAISSMPLMYLAISFANMSANAPVAQLVRATPDWIALAAPGLMIGIINRGPDAAALALLLVQITLPLWLGMQLLRYQLRNGVVASSSREASRSVRPAAPRHALLARLAPASPIKRRELLLLARDRNFLIQSLLLPLLIFGSQLMFTGSPEALSEIGNSPRFLAATAFGIGSYMLMLSAFQTLNNEGHALWMLYTFPAPIEQVLKEKAEFWSVLALLYPLLMLGAGIWFAPESTVALLELGVMVLAGIPIFAVIAVSLGVFGCDPLAQEIRTRVRPSYVYLYMMLSGVYVFAVTAQQWSQKLVILIMMSAFAAALWQKARDQLPYLLDPSASPPARVSTADGLIAAMLFFVLQAAFSILLLSLRMAPAEAILIAFAAAGIMVYAIMRLVYVLTRASKVPAMLHGPLRASFLWGACGGLMVAAIGYAYLLTIRQLGLFDGQTAMPDFDPRLMFALAVVAAPLCEEFIFRGLIFGGLRRSMGLLPSMLISAALFAIIHPPVSIVPVFVLGLCTAWVYDRTKALLAPVLVHAVYNAFVIGMA